jgi:MOSC domain-containing protein YiiM
VAEVAHVFLCKVHRMPMMEVEEAETVVDKGFRECIHGRKNSRRQVSLMDIETLEKLGVAPGQVKENITTRRLNMRRLKPGVRLRVGESLLEVTVPCNPCPRMDEIRRGLEKELAGQRGWLCRVVEAGAVRRGDGIEILETTGE